MKDNKIGYRFNSYCKKDSSWMIFLNNTNKCSLGITDKLPQPYGKYTTEGQRKILNVLSEILDSLKPFELDISNIDYDKHTGGKAKTAIGDLYITDKALIGGIPTGTDGSFLVRDGQVFNLDQWVNIDPKKETNHDE